MTMFIPRSSTTNAPWCPAFIRLVLGPVTPPCVTSSSRMMMSPVIPLSRPPYTTFPSSRGIYITLISVAMVTLAPSSSTGLQRIYLRLLLGQRTTLVLYGFFKLTTTPNWARMSCGELFGRGIMVNENFSLLFLF